MVCIIANTKAYLP